jgi:crossover junction endodeoxyribonuclease RuvC
MTDTLTLEPHTAPATTEPPTVIGLDTAIGSFDSTGTGIASSNGWCDSVGYLDRRNKKKPFSSLPHPQRLHVLTDLSTRVILGVGQPNLVVMELPAPSRSGGGAHERAWLWWDLYRRLAGAGIPVALLTPNQRMLYAVGKGSASKSTVVDAVARRWPDWATGGDDNLADAVVLMAAGRDWLGHPIADMPKANRAAFDKAIWPDLARVAA